MFIYFFFLSILVAVAVAVGGNSSERDIVVFDTETTGLSPKDGDRIVELAGIRLRRGKVVGTFHTYINAKRESNPFALKVHGLTSEFLADKPVFSEVVDQWEAFVGDSVLVAHYAVFDVGHLEAVYADLGRVRPKNAVLCTKVLARLCLPLTGYSLVNLVAYFGIEARPAHTATGDAGMTADAFLRLRAIFRSQGRGSLKAMQAAVDSAPADLRKYSG